MDRELDRLEDMIDKIWDLARGMGLDPYPTHFEIVPAAIMYEFGSYGIPGRFSHWTHGKAYYRMKTSYDYGLSKIYELVVNTNPCYAFLMDTNGLMQNSLVVAHVLAHCDFFKNNAYFQHTNRQMIEAASVHADRIRGYEFSHGEKEVEEFLDAVLAVQEHVDPHLLIRRRTDEEREAERHQDHSVQTPYDDLWKLDERHEDDTAAHVPIRSRRLPEEPEKDLLRFVYEHAPHLEDWQRDIVAIVREEMLYFVPQMQTKIMNEGWASYWHARIMRELDLDDAQYTEFAALHAGVLAPSRTHLNPYHLGMKMYEDIERRANEAGKDGRAEIFAVRELDNDVSFIRNRLNHELAQELDLYVYKREDDKLVVAEKEWERVRDGILSSMTNFGNPTIMVEDGDYRRNRELYLKHYFEGQELDVPYAEKTLQHMYTLWGRPVHLETIADGKKILLSFDGDRNYKRTV